jgi:hypothetical protein
VQAALRRAFRRWGLPGRLRVDNGAPWGATGGLPTALALRLLGLGVGVAWNRPRRPQQNGVVERSQGTARAWAEPHACDTPEQPQARLDEADRWQRERYPAAGGRRRLEAHPGLAHSGRRYGPRWEQRHWDLGAALGWLGRCVVRRRVGGDGKVSVYDRPRSVGVAHRGREVCVTLDADRREWVVRSAAGAELRRCPAEELDRDAIRGLRVARPRGPTGQTSCPD